MIAADERTAEFSIAVEYRGPPVGYDIPRAIPIEIDSIPVAAVASVAVSDGVSTLPVVHPLLSPSTIKKFPSPVRGTAVGSPTSVIAFEPSGEVGTSGALVASSGEVGGSEIVPSSSDLRASESSWCDIVPERPSTDSVLSSDFGSPTADIDCYTEDEDEEGFDGEGRRPAFVTFEDSAESSGPVGVAEAVPELAVKKGACYRCLQGSRFTEKEACLVCNAKYCSRCVLRAMGSMPEGRKCVGCMGSPIEESRRERLGKSSRLLKRLLSSLEVQQVLKAEKECEANQLRPDFVCVNGRKLGPEEMVLLQSCSCPPTKLKPGYYWYDKVAGFWGKEGQKPHQIISPHLNVGAGIMRHASKGDTGILINDREITKSELRMLQWAGVQCAGKPHFWVNADGTYQEEGQKNIKGKLWEKPTTKLLCSFLSLPVPSKATNPSGEDVPNTINRVMPEYLEKKTLQKILLVGSYGSGTSTIFKQAKFLYRSIPFSDDERQSIKVMIHSNIYTYLGILLEGRERFEEESLLEINKARSLHSSGTENDISDDCGEVTEYSISPRLKAFSDWLLKVMASGDLEAIFPAATREYAPKVEELWNNAAIQATYRRRNELPLLPSVASYFLERVVDISRADYDPSDTDILYANGITSSNGLACTDFIFPQGASSENGIDGDDQQDTHPRYYQLIRVHTKGLGENCKWLDMFEDVRMVVFCVSLSDYNAFFEDSNGITVNKMMESKKLFQSIIAHPTFNQMDFLVILNKFDLLEQKIDSSPLTLCEWFGDFNPVLSSHRTNKNSTSRNNSIGSTLPQMAFYYIAVKFKQLFTSYTGRKLYVTSANGLDMDSVDAALRYAREVLKWKEERPRFGTSEYSAYSTEPSTYSQ